MKQRTFCFVRWSLWVVFSILFMACPPDDPVSPVVPIEPCTSELIFLDSIEVDPGVFQPDTIRTEYICNELVVDLSGIPENELQILLHWFDTSGYLRIDTCRCEDSLSLWRNISPDVDVIGVIDDPPPEVEDVGGHVMLNYLSEFAPADSTKIIEEDEEPPRNPQFHGIDPSGSVRVAFVDSGIEADPATTVLRNYYWQLPPNDLRNIDCLDSDEPDDYLGVHINRELAIIDRIGHGTHVNGIFAGVPLHQMIIAAGSENFASFEVVNIQIDRQELEFKATTFDLLCGIYTAISAGPQVINLSVGFADTLPIDSLLPLQRCLETAIDQNILIVAGMGNKGFEMDGDLRFWPACYAAHSNLVISVGATYPEQILQSGESVPGARWEDSNWGPTGRDQFMTIAAWGVDVPSTYPVLPDGGGGFAFMTGTSMATPFVSRQVALLLNGGRLGAPVSPEAIKSTLLDEAILTGGIHHLRLP